MGFTDADALSSLIQLHTTRRSVDVQTAKRSQYKKKPSINSRLVFLFLFIPLVTRPSHLVTHLDFDLIVSLKWELGFYFFPKMTTAARPTWAPAKGGNEQGGARIFGASQKYSSRDVAAHTTLKPR